MLSADEHSHETGCRAINQPIGLSSNRVVAADSHHSLFGTMGLRPLIFLAAALLSGPVAAQEPLDEILPVRGLSIAAPAPEHVDEFVAFIQQELIPLQVNTLVLRVDFDYEYESYPEVRGDEALSKEEVRRIVDAARSGSIRVIPLLNLLGHQSWHGTAKGLLREFPEFDETPHIELPEEFIWPNEDELYVKSYCPLHLDVHEVVFALVDELVEVFEADAFHAGMDEVFYIGHDQCSRCAGKDKAELFADEVTRIRDHLAAQGRELWIWGDRLLDGETTGLGMWEASTNDTFRAIDLIPRDVVITDWHYTRAAPTAPLFAMKGLRVISCPFRYPEVATEQLAQMLMYRRNTTPQTRDLFAGVMQTIWSDAKTFMDQYYGRVDTAHPRGGDQAATFKALFESIGRLDVEN
ncbi:MAG: family 20 glycosylhydrolase [Bacteroidota bacterium]|nr:family 20 glycosylhydrolase [Bacteroidota bacterium]